MYLGLRGGKSFNTGNLRIPTLGWLWSGASLVKEPNPILQLAACIVVTDSLIHPLGLSFLFHGSSESDIGSALRRQVQDFPAPLQTLAPAVGEA